MSYRFNPFTSNFDQVLPVTTETFGSSPNVDGASVDSANNLTLQPADATHPGGVSTTTQSFSGNKTFTGSVAINGAVTLSALQASTALVSDGSKDIISSTTTATEIGYVSGVTGAIQTQLNATEKTANKGAANGYCPLDASSKVPAANLPSTVFEYQGAWDPSTNTPTLTDLTGVAGYVYRVSATFAGPIVGLSDPSMVNFQVGNLVIYSGSVWQQTSAVDGVVSVNGAQGAVTVNAINQLTGDGTAGPASQSASAAFTLATVNSNVGTFASSTVNAKGLVTAAANLSGAATTSGSALTLATVNSNVGSFSNPTFTVNAKGLITAATDGTIPGDIPPTSFTAANNISSPASVTAFAFANATTGSFESLVQVFINASVPLKQTFRIQGTQIGAGSWNITQTTSGDNSGINFTINSSGQILYTSPNSSGWTATTIKFRAITLSL